MSDARHSTMFGVALIAFSALVLEVDITRIFAVTLWYYFGFVAISLALLGTAAAGVMCYVNPVRWTGDNYRRHMGSFAIALAVLCPLVIGIHLSSDFSDYTLHHGVFFAVLGMQMLGFFALFFCAGMVIAIAIFRFRDEIARLYFYDLAGASLGSLAVILLLYHVSAPAVAFAVSAAALLAALLFLGPVAGRTGRAALMVACVAAAGATAINDSAGLLAVGAVKSYETYGVQNAEEGKVYEQWSPVSRVAVFAPRMVGGYERMRVTNDAGAPTTLHRFDGNWSAQEWILTTPSNVGLQLRPQGDSLVIGPGGGMDVLSALRFGNRQVTAVEINPVIAGLVKGRYADYIGHIFDDPRVSLRVQEGRNFAAGSPDRYDLITITMIDSWAGAAAGAYMFSENTLYTYDAVSDYYRHLKDDGILSISRYYQWDEALRIANTYVDYLTDQGVQDARRQVLVVVERPRPYRRATLLLRKGPFTEAEVQKVAALAAAGGYTVLHAPYPVPQAVLEGRSAGRFFRELLTARPAERKSLVAGYARDVSPSTDDRPFFFFMDRVRDTFDPDERDHPARRLAMPILYFVFLLFASLAVLTIFLPLRLRSDLGIRSIPRRTPILLYFAGIGVGFMFVEISLIHRLTVFLGHPTYSFVVVLFSILLASGFGSLLSERLSLAHMKAVLTAVVATVCVVAFTIYDRLAGLMWLEFPWRVAVSVAILVPIGLLLGMCFPLGVRWARESHDHLIPWGWAVNGVFSVFAASASLVIAINFGLKSMMLAGAACYLANVAIVMAVGGVRTRNAPAAEPA
jgi:spermidine synthase